MPRLVPTTQNFDYDRAVEDPETADMTHAQFFADPLLLEAPGNTNHILNKPPSSPERTGGAAAEAYAGQGLPMNSSPARSSMKTSSVSIGRSARSRRSIGSESGMQPSCLPTPMSDDNDDWVEDTSSKECLLCLEKFDLVVRR